ncbi:MAG: flagellinolysin [Lachnospiraceae bacterium]|nr:flagellinolysin [Lachnospiraceae bacterium]
MLSVQTNIAAWNAERQLGITTKKTAKSTERLSSGYKINRAADDAAGLSISEKMRRQVRGLTQATLNAQDGISMVQTAEGAMNEIHDMLHRMNELSVKAATGTLTDSDRMMVDAEVQQLKTEIDGITDRTTFNEIDLFPDSGHSPYYASQMESKNYELTYDLTNGSIAVNSMDGMNGAAGVSRAVQPVSSGSVLADTIANELIPKAAKQIMDAFPALNTAVGTDTIKLGLSVSYIDGPNRTLAYASFRFYNNGKPFGMAIKVDAADFNAADAEGTGSRAEALRSTVAHELMHSVMQYTLTDGMSGRKGSKFPTWFAEGTAQLAGGGFATGWNDALTFYADKLTSENDTSQDANFKKYIQYYTVAGRPYGHGYLAAAYAGYLSNIKNGGSTAVTGQNIAAGMNKIFEDLLNGKRLDAALKDNSGYSEQQLKDLFQNGDADLVEFVRKLSYESKGGAGSVITNALNVGGSSLIDTNGSDSRFYVDSVFVDLSGPVEIGLQVGAEAGQHIEVNLFQMNTMALGLEETNVRTTEDADNAINAVKAAITAVSSARSYYGAIQNRLEHTINNLENVTENTTAAESRIRDADIAEEMVWFSNNQILMQAGTSMLAQANQQSQMILSLLG